MWHNPLSYASMFLKQFIISSVNTLLSAMKHTNGFRLMQLMHLFLQGSFTKRINVILILFKLKLDSNGSIFLEAILLYPEIFLKYSI